MFVCLFEDYGFPTTKDRLPRRKNRASLFARAPMSTVTDYELFLTEAAHSDFLIARKLNGQARNPEKFRRS
jgi:hypothetical protein